jgi:hypothetical protein
LVIAGRTAKYFFAGGQGNHASAGGVGAILGAKTLDRHFIADLKVVLPPAPPGELNGGARFELPLIDARVGFHIDVKPGVRVHPFDFGNDAFYANRFVQIELRREGMMRQGRTGNHGQESGNRKSELFHE